MRQKKRVYDQLYTIFTHPRKQRNDSILFFRSKIRKLDSPQLMTKATKKLFILKKNEQACFLMYKWEITNLTRNHELQTQVVHNRCKFQASNEPNKFSNKLAV